MNWKEKLFLIHLLIIHTKNFSVFFISALGVTCKSSFFLLACCNFIFSFCSCSWLKKLFLRLSSFPLFQFILIIEIEEEMDQQKNMVPTVISYRLKKKYRIITIRKCTWIVSIISVSKIYHFI